MSLTGSGCKRCGGAALSENEFHDAVRRAGLHVDDHGRVALRLGGIAGSMTSVGAALEQQRVEQQAKFEAIENTKGFRCTGCRTVYCMNCLFRFAPQHPNGGKACPACGSTFQRFT